MAQAASAIVGVGGSAITRRSDAGILGLALDAALAALADAGLSRDEIDGYVGSPKASHPAALHVDGADEVSARSMVPALGLGRMGVAIDLNSAFAPEMVATAQNAIAAGAARRVLVVRALYNVPDLRYGEVVQADAHGVDQFTVPFAYNTGGARFATRARDYMERSGAGRRDLFEVVSLMRRNARGNPAAIWRDRGLEWETYRDAAMVTEPLCLYDCDMPVCGAVAWVMTGAGEAARRWTNPVFVQGTANWTQADRIFARAGCTPADVRMAQIYDGFSHMVWGWLERLGWAEEGRAWRFVNDGHCEPWARLSLNTFGGSIGEGRLHGAGHLREAVLQLSGRAGGRQVAGVDRCLVQAGPHDYASLVILGTEPNQGDPS